jgi:SAM-dependent methyltransferase
VHREWLRYEGTPQRELYRELRERFLRRHVEPSGWTVDLGTGPGRFLPWIGRAGSRRIALDASREMLTLVPSVWKATGGGEPLPGLILGLAERPPLRRGRWSEVVALGNTLGFAGRQADRVLDEAEGLVAPGGSLLLEVAPAPGERSRYLGRLPPSAVARLFLSPVRAILNRMDREGFRAEPPRHPTPETFRRFDADELHQRLRSSGWEIVETVAVAPSLGADAARIEAVRGDPKAWTHLLELEEEVGRRSDRWPGAAAVLLAARRPSSMRMIK